MIVKNLNTNVSGINSDVMNAISKITNEMFVLVILIKSSVRLVLYNTGPPTGPLTNKNKKAVQNHM